MRLAHIAVCPVCRGRMAFHDAQAIATDLYADSILGPGRDGAAVCECGCWVLRLKGIISIGDGLRLTLMQAAGKVVVRVTEYGAAYLQQMREVDRRGGYWKPADTKAVEARYRAERGAYNALRAA